jgi:DNA-binding LacI/PurR family transcriptional regulator
MTISQRQIAAKLGISPSTVSRALRAEGRISPQTRQMIEQAARELGYDLPTVSAPAPLERILVVFLNKWAANFFGSAVLGMSAAANDRGIRLGTLQTGSYLSPADFINTTVDPEEYQAVVVGMAGSVDIPLAKLKRLEEEGVTVVLLNRSGGDVISSVTLDDYAAGETAAHYFYNCGHRRIAYAAGPMTHASFRRRIAGFTDACTVLGVYDPELIVNLEQDRIGHLIFSPAVADHLYNRPDPPTAIFVAGDHVAHDCISAAQERGLNVPEDLAVIGFDNTELAENLDLTSFDFRQFELGQLAVKLAAELHAGTLQSPVHAALPPQLILRGSSGKEQVGAANAVGTIGR